MLEKIKILLGFVDNDTKDDLLITLIGLARDEATEYCNLLEYTEKLDPAVINMVIERYNRIGAEGLTSASSHNIQEHYINGYSSSVINKLNRHRRIRML